MDNDLISRSELLGKFTAMLIFSSDRVVLIENVIEQIQNAPTVEERPQGEWIPVSERLPEQNGYYITTCRDICENRVHTVGFDGVRKKWGRGGVIAWQPLPEPYKQI